MYAPQNQPVDPALAEQFKRGEFSPGNSSDRIYDLSSITVISTLQFSWREREIEISAEPYGYQVSLRDRAGATSNYHVRSDGQYVLTGAATELDLRDVVDAGVRFLEAESIMYAADHLNDQLASNALTPDAERITLAEYDAEFSAALETMLAAENPRDVSAADLDAVRAGLRRTMRDPQLMRTLGHRLLEREIADNDAIEAGLDLPDSPKGLVRTVVHDGFDGLSPRDLHAVVTNMEILLMAAASVRVGQHRSWHDNLPPEASDEDL